MSNQRPVAIVGLGCVLPDAQDPQTFWQNIRTGWNAVREVPSNRWNPAMYYDPDPSVPDKTYSKIGAWVQGFTFDPFKLGFAVPPRVVVEWEETQKWALSASHQALADYGYPRRPLDPNRVAVILGNLMAGEKHYITGLRIRLPEYQAALESSAAFRSLPKETQEALVEGMRAAIHARIPTSTEDTLPGELANVIAGRVANLFNFTGPNFVTDAACASSMAAFQCAVDGLNNGQFDAVLTGGVDRNMGPDGFVKFCKIGALSPDGSRPYAEGANGFVMGEGAAVFLMKRLADAERDGDRIYAVIRGMGGSSDGKGKSITAPNPTGQMRAIERAWKNAGLSPDTASLIEGHGTATQVGDVAEVASLNSLFQEFALPAGKIALGSVKSNVGHLKAAAGAVSLLKILYALHDRILPPSINFEQPNSQIDFAHSPFRVNTTTHPWELPRDSIRRAGISSFGFGGTNFHMVVEEYVPGLLTGARDSYPGVTLTAAGRDEPQPATQAPVSPAMPAISLAARVEKAAPVPAFYRGIFFLSADDPAGLRASLAEAIAKLRQGNVPPPVYPSPEALRKPERLAMDYSDPADLLKRAEKAAKTLEVDAANAWQSLAGQGIFRGHGAAGKLVFLFPGQGSQYANMLRDLCDVEPVVADTFKEADEVMTPLLGRPLTSYIFVGEDPAAMKAAEEALKNTVITQPAVLTANVALLCLLAKFGFEPDLVAGHSLGEYAALVAAGVLSFREALEVVSSRGRAMTELTMEDNGCMAAVSAPLPEIERILQTVEGYVVIANINSPVQSVIGGTTPAVDAAIKAFDAAGYQAVKIPVSHAFHTKIVAPASRSLREAIARMDIRPPCLTIVANVSGEEYPTSRDEILDILGRQVASPVQFVRSMQTLYALGGRTYVEVGPKRVLNALGVDNLKEHADVTLLATNHPRKGGLASFNEALAGLLAAGIGPRWGRGSGIGGDENRESRIGEGENRESRVESRTLDGMHHEGAGVGVEGPDNGSKAKGSGAKENETQANVPGSDGAQIYEEIKATLLKEVSEKTGYPVEMLGLELDMETDLGIDTVKQAELFMALREHYAIPRPDNLRLSDYNTLAKVIGFAEAGLHGQNRAEDPKTQPTEASGTPRAEIRPEPETQPASPADDEISQVVLAMVSEKTGYPTEMLDLNLDLESDLGVDTVKQAELFMALRERYAIPRPEDLRLSDYNTLAKVIGFFRAARPDAPGTASTPTAGPVTNPLPSRPVVSAAPVIEDTLSISQPGSATPESPLSNLDSRIPNPLPPSLRRRIPEPRLRLPLACWQPTGVRLAAGSRVLVVRDLGGLADALTAGLAGLGCQVIALENASPEALGKQAAGLAVEAPFDGVYYLPAFDPAPAVDALTPEGWQALLDLRLLTLFALLRALPGQPFLVCATRLGGLHGFGPGPSAGLPGAGVCGFAKALAREREGSLVKAVDFTADVAAAEAAGRLIAETLSDAGCVEVGWRAGCRFEIGLREEPISDQARLDLPAGSVYLVSGGSGGITGRVALDLAQAAPGVFYLLGRSPLPDRSDLQLNQLKGNRDTLKKALGRPGVDGLKLNPAEVETRLAALERAAATLETIDTLHAMGSKATYLACDVTDFQSVRQVVQTVVGAEGRVDVLVHAAGYESSHRLDRKTFEEIRQTLAVKAIGFFNLVKALAEQNCLPGAVVGFSSIAGRFGNSGQTDYSAANALLSNLITSYCRDHPEVKGHCIDWGPWAEVGMASRGHIPTLMKMAGVEMLQPQAAAPRVRSELLFGQGGEVMVTGTLGPAESQADPYQKLDMEAVGHRLGRLAGGYNGVDSNGAFTFEAELDPQAEPFLKDHALNGIPILPGVIGIQGFRSVASFLTGHDAGASAIQQLEDIQFLAPVKFYRSRPHRVTWKALVRPTEQGLVMSLTLESDLELRSRPREHLLHFSATVRLPGSLPDVPEKPAARVSWDGARGLKADEIYRLYFHGPAFQLLEEVIRAGNGVAGRMRMERPALAVDLSSATNDPALLEFCMQTAGIWEIGKTGLAGLPRGIQRLAYYSQGGPAEEIFAEVTPVTGEDGKLAFDGRVVDGQGRVLLEMQGYHSIALPYTGTPEQLLPLQNLVKE